MPQAPSDSEIYAQLRQTIDQGLVEDINNIFNDYPSLNFNTVTPNKLSALWWALIPPSNKPINLAVVNCLLRLERNNQGVIDLTQTYADLQPDDYISQFIKIDDSSKAVLTSIEDETTRRAAQYIHIDIQAPQLAQDTHSASHPLILHASDANLKRLYQRYGDQLEVEKELKNIEAFLETAAFKAAFPLIREQQDQIHHALKRIKNNNESRSGATDEGPHILKEALALVWIAAHEKDPLVLPNQASTDPIDRQKAILTSLLEAQSAYGLDKYSCWVGTWGRIGTALCGLHQDVVYQEENELPLELTRYQYSALIGNQLDQTYQNDRPTYWAILRYMLLDDRKEDQLIYATWLEKTKPFIENELRQSRATEEDIASLIQQAEAGYLPTSTHLLTFQFSFLLNKFSAVKKPDLFTQHLELLQNEDINEVFQGLKTVYYECMAVPNTLNDLEIQNKEALKQSILESLLTNRDAEEITEEKLWPVARTELRIKMHLLNRYSWYQNLTLDKQLLLTQEQPDLEAITEKTIFLFALKHACVTGLSLAGADLSDMDFRGWDLRGIDFSGANLTGTDLRLILAQDAKWEKCNLERSYFNQWLYPEALIGSVHCTSELLVALHIEGNTVLHVAAGDNNLASVQAILKSDHCTKELLATRNNYNGETVLHNATYEHNLEIIQAIIKSNHCTREVLIVKNNYGDTALHIAVDTNFLAGAQAIIKSNHCTREVLIVKNNDGDTALHLAVRKNKFKIVQAILDSPYCVNNVLATQNNFGETALHIAVRNNNPKIVQAILQSPSHSKILLQIKNQSGETIADTAKNATCSSEIKQMITFAKKGKKNFFIHITLPHLLKNKTRSEILDLFKDLKDKEKGKYNFIHEQKNKTWGERRLNPSSKFFKSHRTKGECDFWHTHISQQAVKLLKKAYLNANGPVEADKEKEEQALLITCEKLPLPISKRQPHLTEASWRELYATGLARNRH